MKRNIVALVFVLTAIFSLAHWFSLSRTRAYDLRASAQEVDGERGYLAGAVGAHAAGRGNPWVTFRDGHEAPARYQGSAELIQQLQDNQSRPLSLASADFDEDGVPDLVAGYAEAGDGVISIQRGDVDAIFPNTPEALAHRAQLRASNSQANPDAVQSPFFATSSLFHVPGTPQIIGTGDFDADGHNDVVLASTGGSALVFLPGNGQGGFGPARSIEVPGTVTALVTGDVNRMDGLADLIVAVNGAAGPRLLIYEGGAGALNAAPEIISLPAESRSIAVGQLDDDYAVDMAVAAGGNLLIIQGRDRKSLADNENALGGAAPRVTRLAVPFTITSLAIADLSGDLRNEIALLSSDGTCHIFSRAASTKGSIWREESVAASPLSQMNAPAGSSRTLIPVRISSSPKDDLVVLDQAGRQLHMLINESATLPQSAAKSPTSSRLILAGSVDIDGEPVALLGMRLNSDAVNDLVVLKSNTSAPIVVTSSPAMTFTVINTNDAGAGSLRAAITSANSNAGPDAISFAIPGAGTQTITLLSALPAITQPLTLDGTTQAPGSATPPIELNGTSVPAGLVGLNVTGGSSTIRGLVINRFPDGVGLQLAGAAGDIVEGNYIGTNAAGTAAQGNGDAGVFLSMSSGHRVGGTTAAARNVISGNVGPGVLVIGPAMTNQIQGNYIGTNAAGSGSIGNLADGIEMLSGAAHDVMNCTVGGTAAGAGNVISANGGVGVQLITIGTSNLVQGNLIGTDATGSNDLGNSSGGVAISEAASNTIGGSVAGAGNVISGNDLTGVTVNSATSTLNLIQGNKIGTRADGTTSLPNSADGVLVLNSASNNTIGGSAAAEGNVIAFNLGAGVMIETGTGNAIRSNSIFSNTGLGIDLAPAGVTPNDVNDPDTGANNLQNFPVLTTANGVLGGGVNIQGTLNSTTNTTFTLDFFSNPSCDGSGNGEGRTFLGSGMATTAGNNVTFNITLVGASASVGQSITATATNPQGNTSEFSACIPYGGADLSINKTSAATIVVGSNVTYTITVTNNGPDPASSITVTDNLPSTVAFVSCSSTGAGVCTGIGNNRTVSFTSLGSGASATITIVATLSCSVADGATIGNTASVTAPLRDPTSANNSSTANFTASNPPRTILPTSESFASDGGDGTVSVTAPSGCGWQAIPNVPWLTITAGSIGSGNGTVGYHVAINSTGIPRSGTITIAGLTFTVNQSNVACAYSIMPTSNSFPSEGGSGSVSVTTVTGCTWKADSNDSWIILQNSGGSGNGSVNYTVEANPSTSPRTGTVTIAGKTFTVDQAGNPSAVTLVSFTADEYENGVALQWQTGMEVENLGFRVYRQQAGQRVRITPEILAGSALIAGDRTKLPAGNSYVWWDDGIADCGSPTGNCRDIQYWLEDLDLTGKTTLYGPIVPRKIGGAPAKHGTATLLSRLGKGEPEIKQLAANQATQVSMSQKQSAAQWELPSQPSIKLTIREEGWYRVAQPELIAAGLDPKTDPRNLRLYLGGQEQALMVVGEQDGSFDQADAIEFYATGQDVPSTDTHTYWLVGGKQPGKRISSVKSDAAPGGSRSFAYTVERKEKTIYFSSLRNGEAENFFGPVIASQPVDQELTLQHLDTASPEDAVIEIALQGVTDLPGINPDHQVKVMLNGQQVGRMMFDGRQHSIERVTVPHSLLREGANVVTLMAEGGPSDVALLDYVRVTYRHAYAADQDTLRMSVSEQAGAVVSQSQTISGFSNSMIRVVDIANSREPQELIGRIEEEKGGSFAVTVNVVGSAPHTLIAFTEGRIKRPVLITANQVSSWRDSSHAADLLMITHRDFLASLSPLKALRQKQGLDVEIVDVEDIYDEFSFGEKQPRAIKDFLSWIKETWKKSPRFVLLVGDASFDSRNYLGAGDFDFVPTRLIDTFYLETASDDWFADFNDDGLAEMSIGRLPARTAAESAALVSKIVNYDSAGVKTPASGRSVLLVADKNDGFNFEQASELLRALVAPGVGVREIFRGRLDDEGARKQLIEAINSGQSIVNYMGHGSTNSWRDLFTADDARSLNNLQRLPLFITMTCLNGFFHDPVIESLGEGLLKSERGGAIAVWASSGLTDPARQTALNQQAYRLLFDPTKPTIGEATTRAKAAVHDNDVRRTWILLGDPTSRLR